jgi:hypothetical protein
MPIFHIMCLRAAEKEEHMINWLVSRIDPPHCHVEWCGEDSIGCSIFAGETVFYRKRRYLNLRYDTVSVNCSDDEYARMVKMCQRLSEKAPAFDAVSMYSTTLRRAGLRTPWCHMGHSLQSGRTYCSKLVGEILAAGRIKEIANVDVHTLTPSTLYHLFIESSNRVFAPPPSRLLIQQDVTISKDGIRANVSRGVRAIEDYERRYGDYEMEDYAARPPSGTTYAHTRG